MVLSVSVASHTVTKSSSLGSGSDDEPAVRASCRMLPEPNRPVPAAPTHISYVSCAGAAFMLRTPAVVSANLALSVPAHPVPVVSE